MILLLRFYVFLKIQKNVTLRFLLCFTRFLELWLGSEHEGMRGVKSKVLKLINVIIIVVVVVNVVVVVVGYYPVWQFLVMVFTVIVCR